MKKIHQTSGFLSFYTGFIPRTIHYTISSIFTCTLYERLEEKLREINRAN